MSEAPYHSTRRSCAIVAALALSLAFALCATILDSLNRKEDDSVSFRRWAKKTALRQQGTVNKDDNKESNPKRLDPIEETLEAFDCTRVKNECRYFRPVQFFTNNGEGYKYLDRLESYGADHPHLAELTYLQWSDEIEEKVEDGGSQADDLRKSIELTYFHTRKAGGTSIQAAMKEFKIQRQIHGDQVNYRSLKPQHVKPEDKYKFEEASISILQKIQNDSKPLDEQLDGKMKNREVATNEPAQSCIGFTVIRDPVSRFLSAVTQALGQFGTNKELRKTCLQSTGRKTVMCVIDEIKRKGMRIDIHFCPTAVNLYVAARNIDIRVTMFPMRKLTFLLQDIFGVETKKMRDRTDPSYTKSDVLSSLSVNDLTSEMIQQVCELYSVDVDMVHSLGFAVPYCDDQGCEGKPCV